MELRGERVCCIYDETDAVFTAEHLHRLSIECPVYALPMMQGDVLFSRLRAVIIGIATLFQHFHSLAPLSRSSEYKYHIYNFSPQCEQ